MLDKIHTDDNLVDMFTKVVTKEKLNSSLASVGLLDRIEEKNGRVQGGLILSHG